MNFPSDNHNDQSPHHSQEFQGASYSQQAPIIRTSDPGSSRAAVKSEGNDLPNLQYPESPGRQSETRLVKQEEPEASTSFRSVHRRTSHTSCAKAPLSVQHSLAAQTNSVITLHNHEAQSPEQENSAQEIAPRAKKRGGAAVAKRFGSISGFSVLDTFDYREEFADLHPPPMAGIYADFTGAYSVVMSGGYVDDRDEGDTVIYTGEGGRVNKVAESTGKTSFSQKQAKNQEWTRGNKGLQLNVTTRNPIRLVRGPFKKLGSPYAHADKYRYDGLYTVERAWQEVGQEGFLMCRFEFKRLPGQPEIPRLSGDGFRPRARTKRSSPRETAAADYEQGERSLKRSRIPELSVSSTIAGPSTNGTRADAIVKPEPVSSWPSPTPFGNTVSTQPQPRVITQVATINPTPSTSAASFFSIRRPLLLGMRTKQEPE